MQLSPTPISWLLISDYDFRNASYNRQVDTDDVIMRQTIISAPYSVPLIIDGVNNNFNFVNRLMPYPRRPTWPYRSVIIAVVPGP